MILLNKMFFGLALITMTIASANAYNAEAYQSAGQDYTLITVYEDSHGALTGYGRFTVWDAGLNEVIL